MAELFTGSIPPNQTLYANNLNDKINIKELIHLLYELFVPYGEVLDIVAKRGSTRRGQAFIVFKEIASATNALRSLQGRVILNKKLNLNYAKTKSNATLIQSGAFRPKKPRLDKVEDPGLSNSLDVSTIFVENLPPDTTQRAIEILFSQYPGYISSRLIQERGVAFVDYEKDTQAEVTIQGLQGFRITPDYAISLKLSNRE